MQGKPSTDFPFNTKLETKLHAWLTQARQARMVDKEVDDLVESNIDFDREVEELVMDEATEERLLRDYGRANT